MRIKVNRRIDSEYVKCIRPGCSNKSIREISGVAMIIDDQEIIIEVAPKLICRKARCLRFVVRSIIPRLDIPEHIRGNKLTFSRLIDESNLLTGHPLGCGCEFCGGCG